MKFFFLLFLIISCSFTQKSKKEKGHKLFSIGKLFDSKRGIWLSNQKLLVLEDKVVDVNPTFIPEKTEYVDYRKNYVIPGLIDSHTHLFLNDPSLSKDFSQGLLHFYRENDTSERLALGRGRAESLLKAGFTSLRDLGNQGKIRTNQFLGWPSNKVPRVFTSGPGIVPNLGQFPPGTKKSVIEGEYFLMMNEPFAENEIHLIKLYADEEPNASYANLKIMKKWVKFAHDKGFKVAVHAILPEGISLAIKSGADTLEHGTDISSEQLKKMAEKKMIFVPATSHSLFLLPQLKKYKAHDTKKMVTKNCSNIRQAKRKGVSIAFGSDNYYSLESVGVDFGQASLHVLLHYAQCGLTPEEVLKSATFTAAKTMGQERTLGQLIPGAYADFIVLEGNPARRLETLRSPYEIYKGGTAILNANK